MRTTGEVQSLVNTNSTVKLGLTLCDPMDYTIHGILQTTGVGSLSLFQEIFPTQGSNPGPPHCRQILNQLSHQGSQQQ